ncbi:unnamed protein product [Adineta steineri]|uniref:G-protein coupled receptors family 1 profile domain-containing protein n=1 Tax=Adineta steineri TaxID=433720 RepID=A0A814WBK9_9BILA|nr:unnamed protein product [Adineta steineri]CAF1467033.1 unnamed protein product [Adineta steineri]
MFIDLALVYYVSVNPADWDDCIGQLLTELTGVGRLVCFIENYRKTPCTFYFLICSITNILYLLINLTSRIVSVGYGIDLTHTSIIWCKTRQYLLLILSLISFTCSWLSSVDQYFVTSRHANLRRMSNIKWTHRIVFILILVSCLHGIPCFIIFNISSITNQCINSNIIYAIYSPIYSLTFTCFGPSLIMILFGYLTIRNIHLTRVLVQQQIDRQLIKMTLFQVILIAVFITPYSINVVYILITNGMIKDTNRLIIENSIFTILTLLTYVYYSGSCYIFLLSSSRFRRTVKKKIFIWRKPNQINPIQQPTI